MHGLNRDLTNQIKKVKANTEVYFLGIVSKDMNDRNLAIETGGQR